MYKRNKDIKNMGVTRFDEKSIHTIQVKCISKDEYNSAMSKATDTRMWIHVRTCMSIQL